MADRGEETMNQLPYLTQNPEEMSIIQQTLRQQIQIQPLVTPPKILAGVDVAYTEEEATAVIVVWERASKTIIETVIHSSKDYIYPYIPGFLAFRELPVFLDAWDQLRSNPDLVVFDGNGMLHPQRVGLATHASFLIDKPTMGIAKTPYRLGEHPPLAESKGSYQLVEEKGEIVGAVLRTQTGIKPVYVSVGNRITLEEVIEISMEFVEKYSRVPEITRQPDLLTRQANVK